MAQVIKIIAYGQTGTKTSTTHYVDVIMDAMASQITSVMIVCSIVYLCADKRKQQSSVSLAIVKEIDRWPVNSPHKRPVTQKIFPFDDVIMYYVNPAVPQNARMAWANIDGTAQRNDAIEALGCIQITSSSVSKQHFMFVAVVSLTCQISK